MDSCSYPLKSVHIGPVHHHRKLHRTRAARERVVNGRTWPHVGMSVTNGSVQRPGIMAVTRGVEMFKKKLHGMSGR